MLAFHFAPTVILASLTYRGAKVELMLDKGRSVYSVRSQTGRLIQTFHFRDLFGGEVLHYAWSFPQTLAVRRIGLDGSTYLIAMLAIHANSGGMAGIAHIFTSAKGRLKEVCRIGSNQMFAFPKLGPHRYAIQRSFEIGISLFHSQMPRWQELYQVKGSHLVQVTFDPAFYRPWVTSLWNTLLAAPDELECWHYYGLACKYAGLSVKPKDAYRRMLAEKSRWSGVGDRNLAHASNWLHHRIAIGGWPTNIDPSDRPGAAWFDLKPVQEIDSVRGASK